MRSSQIPLTAGWLLISSETKSMLVASSWIHGSGEGDACHGLTSCTFPSVSIQEERSPFRLIPT